MARKKTITEFLEQAKSIHGEKYDYSKVEYATNKTKVCIICPTHGEFWQIPSAHLRGEGCPECGKEDSHKVLKLSLREFIKKARKIHGDKYDYSKVEYKGNKIKVCIICPKHGEFWQTPNSHLLGHGCPYCSRRSIKYTTEEFIERAKKIHGNKYDYSKVEYVNNETKICIICSKHGEFWMRPNSHISQKQGCPICRNEGIAKKKSKTTEEFINDLKKVHGDKYNYSKVKYIGCYEKVCIICPKHGEFWMSPTNLLNGHGCPNCSNSILETKASNILKNKNIDFIWHCKQDTFSWLGRQSLDFYLPQYNIAIECQGKQHFRPISVFGGEKSFKEQVERDKNKLKLCNENGVKLEYINYDDDINKRLEEILV